MRAAVYHGPRDVRVEDVPEPPAPGPGEVLLEVGLASICGTDAAEYAYGPKFAPLDRPHPGSGHHGPVIIGHEFAGTVVAAGPDVDLEAGRRVACGAGVWCGSCAWCRAGRPNLCERYYTLGLHANGGLADRVVVPAITCAPVPDGCTAEAAAIAQPFAIALHARDRARLQPGESALVIGVGGIGAFLVAAFAARRISPLLAVDLDAERLRTAALLGATDVFEAERGRDDLVPAHVLDVTGGVGVDVAVEATGSAVGLAHAIACVRRGGRVLLVGQHYEPRSIDLFDLSLREIEMTATVAHVCETNLPEALELLASTDLGKNVIDRVVPLEAVVEEGIVVLAEGRARGKIVIEVTP